MSAARWHIVSLDVRDDKRRRRAVRIILGHGERVQYSVFRVHGTDRHILRLRWELTSVLDDADDLLVVPVHDSAATRIGSLRGIEDWTEDAPNMFRIVG